MGGWSHARPGGSGRNAGEADCWAVTEFRRCGGGGGGVGGGGARMWGARGVEQVSRAKRGSACLQRVSGSPSGAPLGDGRAASAAPLSPSLVNLPPIDRAVIALACVGLRTSREPRSCGRRGPIMRRRLRREAACAGTRERRRP